MSAQTAFDVIYFEMLLHQRASIKAYAATRSAIEGTNFGDNIRAAIPDVIGQAVGNALGGAVLGAVTRAISKPNQTTVLGAIAYGDTASTDFNLGYISQIDNDYFTDTILGVDGAIRDVAGAFILASQREQIPITKVAGGYERTSIKLGRAVLNGAKSYFERYTTYINGNSVGSYPHPPGDGNYASIDSSAFSGPTELILRNNILGLANSGIEGVNGLISLVNLGSDFRAGYDVSNIPNIPLFGPTEDTPLARFALSQGLFTGTALSLVVAPETLVARGTGVGARASTFGRIDTAIPDIGVSTISANAYNLDNFVGVIPTINGRRPRNFSYAGEIHPSGVRFTSQGFPDFTPHTVAQFDIEGLTGVYNVDAAFANAKLGISSTPDGYVWHHVENGVTLQLIPQDIHNAARHTGGAAFIRNGGFD